VTGADQLPQGFEIHDSIVVRPGIGGPHAGLSFETFHQAATLRRFERLGSAEQVADIYAAVRGARCLPGSLPQENAKQRGWHVPCSRQKRQHATQPVVPRGFLGADQAGDDEERGRQTRFG